MPRYAVALYIPYVARVCGIDALSPDAAVAAAASFLKRSGVLDTTASGPIPWNAVTPTLVYLEPHEPADAIGALVDEIGSTAGDQEPTGTEHYRALDTIELYRTKQRWSSESQAAGVPT
jgi:hypothetical protein